MSCASPGREERLGAVWLDAGERYCVGKSPSWEAMTLWQFRVLNEHLLGLVSKVKVGRFSPSPVEWPSDGVYRKTRVSTSISVEGAFEPGFGWPRSTR
ncbi:hypothetical protein SAMN00790413_01311 [Deinococcus hopiensis KR-140]|uniref:Uncharacterized protein n=1 Tax=Deinococcus hopiensis KR-140 TaxID=695939 RepID=A0A1W1VFT3_9DEIO|nr:hypothetical protein SAMN00790413_01311 [Deinococcus hopiensis KR-140]